MTSPPPATQHDFPREPPIFTTFGMFILDDIEFPCTPSNPNPTKLTNLTGGAGTYAVLGSRLALSPTHNLSPQSTSSRITWLVDTGTDFPPSTLSLLSSWSSSIIFRPSTTRLTTRAWNGYGPAETRSFHYLTPKLRLEVPQFSDWQIRAESMHMVCSPARCLQITNELSRRRQQLGEDAAKVVWEPIPDLCSPSEMARLREAARGCVVVSPNHEELRLFFAEEERGTAQGRLVEKLGLWDEHEDEDDSAANSPVQYPIVVIREGADGSTAYICIRHPSTPPATQTQPQILTLHLPAYHTPLTSHRVTDPTGGGNTYLGALATCLAPSFRPTSLTLRSPTSTPLPAPLARLATAMVHATVAASFAIEQHGVPVLAQGAGGTRAGEPELWNGESVSARLESFVERLGGGVDVGVMGTW